MAFDVLKQTLGRRALEKLRENDPDVIAQREQLEAQTSGFIEQLKETQRQRALKEGAFKAGEELKMVIQEASKLPPLKEEELTDYEKALKKEHPELENTFRIRRMLLEKTDVPSFMFSSGDPELVAAGHALYPELVSKQEGQFAPFHFEKKKELMDLEFEYAKRLKQLDAQLRTKEIEQMTGRDIYKILTKGKVDIINDLTKGNVGAALAQFKHNLDALAKADLSPLDRAQLLLNLEIVKNEVLKTLGSGFFKDSDAANAFESEWEKATETGDLDNLIKMFTPGAPEAIKPFFGTEQVPESDLKLFQSHEPTQQKLKPLDKETARKILEEAGGDKNKAREIAKQRGYEF